MKIVLLFHHAYKLYIDEQQLVIDHQSDPVTLIGSHQNVVPIFCVASNHSVDTLYDQGYLKLTWIRNSVQIIYG